MKTKTLTIKPDGHAPFTIGIGDKVVVVSSNYDPFGRSTLKRPAHHSVETVSAIIGGRQARIKLDGRGMEFTADGKTSWQGGYLLAAFDEAKEAEHAAAVANYEQTMAASGKIARLGLDAWQQICSDPDMRAKLTALLADHLKP